MPTQTSTYTIVGLSANVKGRAQAFLADLWENRPEVMLCHDEAYRTDPHAVAAIVNGEMVGHVSRRENEQLWGMMQAMAEAQGVGVSDVTIYAEVTEVDRRDGVTEHVSFGVAPDFEGVSPVRMVQVDAWAGWGEGLLPKPKSREDVVLQSTVRSLLRIMNADRPQHKESVLTQLEAYKRLSRHDVSRENSDLLQQLSAWLLAQGDEDLQLMGREYARMHPAMSEEERIEERVTLWWPQMLLGEEGRTLWLDYLRQCGIVGKPTGEQLGQMMSQMMHHLNTMPGIMPQLLNNPREFFKGLFYLGTPRHVLMRVYGCIIVCYYLTEELKGKAMFGLADLSLQNAAGEDTISDLLMNFVAMADKMDEGTIKGSLLLLNRYNIDHHHAYDKEIVALYEKLGIRSTSLVQVTNHFAPGSCTFGAGSSQNGNVITQG